MGESEHRVFDYKPRYYDKEKEELKRRFGRSDNPPGDKYEPGSYIRGSFRDGHYSRSKSHATKAQTIIGIVGLLLAALVLWYIAKFYTLL